MSFDHQHDVARMGNIAQRICGAGNVVFITAGQAQTQAGDLDRIQDARQLCGIVIQVDHTGGDKVDLRQIFSAHRMGSKLDGRCTRYSVTKWL